MKKIFYNIITLFCMLSMMSCNDFLTLDPLGQENSDNYMYNEENATKVINGIYDLLPQTEGKAPDDLWMSHHFDFMLGSIITDDAVKGSKLSDMPELYDVESYDAKVGNSIADAFWMQGFWGISRCNYALKNLPAAPIDEAIKNRLSGECHFLRAYFYIYLLHAFGGVPLFTEPLKPTDFGNVQRASLHDTFEFINKDLEDAIDLLPTKSEYAASDIGRATKGAARAFLAKSLMLQIGVDNEITDETAEWQKVYNLTGDIMLTPGYGLVPNYATLFEAENKNSIESVFEIQAGDGTSGDAPGSVGNAYPLFQANRDANNKDAFIGWGFHNPTQDLVNAFNPTDPRLSCTVYGIGFNNGILYGSEMSYTRTEQGSNYLNRKAAISFIPTLDKAANKDIIVMRYADVLLMHAEAGTYTGHDDIARTCLKQVRDRARTSSYCKGYVKDDPNSYVYPASTPNIPVVSSSESGETLRADILKERRLEFAMESNRMWDLIRTGELLDRVSKVKDTDRIGATSDDEVRHEGIGENIKKHSLVTGVKAGIYFPVLPLPLTEVGSWGLKQNPNY